MSNKPERCVLASEMMCKDGTRYCCVDALKKCEPNEHCMKVVRAYFTGKFDAKCENFARQLDAIKDESEKQQLFIRQLIKEE